MNRKLLASAICTGLFMAGSAFAQDDSTAAQPSRDQTTKNQPAQKTSDNEKDAKNLEAVSVTGSLLNRPEYESTSPVQVINIKGNFAAGAFDTADLLQSSAVAAGSTQINGQFGGYVVDGGTGVKPIDLRGLGANRTLVLLDGQRPGPAGTRGAVGAFDLNVVPSVILGRIEIVKDGSSSIYGSDAISGVVNLITRKRMDGVEVNGSFGIPQHGGGEQASVSIGTGWNFDSGHAMVAAQFQEQFPLAVKQRGFLNCTRDRVYGTDGRRIDRTDLSTLQGTPQAGCTNLYANTIISYYNSRIRYVPSRDGSTSGPFPGYHPRPYPTPRYGDGNPKGAYYEDVLNYPFTGDEWVIDKNRNASLYGSTGLNFGNVNWDTQLLFNHRETRTQRFRQFFPIVQGPAQANGDNLYEPIMPYPSNDKVNVDYLYLASKLSGSFASTDSWGWELNGTYSHSQGTYGHVGIDARKSGDLSYDVNQLDTPPIDYFDPNILSGKNQGQLVNAVGLSTQGKTAYSQIDFNGIFTGDLFELPAGAVSSALGLEFRQTKIDDQPDANNAAGYEWGYSSAQTTQGKDNVREAFAEVGIPLLKDLPGISSLSADVSGRVFRYNSVGSWDKVWKTGLNWQVTPTFRVRGTIGTSYRAPGLYELYLGNQTGFQGQLQIDPCILYNDSTTNQNIKKNCAAAGIPGDYAGGGQSATSHQGGGKGFLKPETSRAKTLGVVWTPTFANVNVALDYFDYRIKGEIATLSASNIVASCYARPVYPNAFCNLFDRNSATDPSPFTINDIYATYINLNEERSRGYDFQVNYSDDYSFGKLSADVQATYTLEDTLQEFSSKEQSGFASTNFIGDIGRPRTVGLAHVSLKRGDWTYSWEGRYNSSTSSSQYDDRVFNYFGYKGATRDIKAGWQFRHSVSVGYDHGKWGLVLGVRNLFDKQPDQISSGLYNARKGNVPLVASQYDWYGRTFFLRTNYHF